MRSRIRIDPLAQKERDRGEADERVDMSKEKYWEQKNAYIYVQI